MSCSNLFCFSISRHSQYKRYRGNLAPINSFSSIAHLLNFLHAAVKYVLVVLSTLFVFIVSMSEIFNFQFFCLFLLSFCLLDHIIVAFPLVYYEFL